MPKNNMGNFMKDNEDEVSRARRIVKTIVFRKDAFRNQDYVTPVSYPFEEYLSVYITGGRYNNLVADLIKDLYRGKEI